MSAGEDPRTGVVRHSPDHSGVGTRREAGPVEASLGPRLAAVIRDTRRRLGWTQQELARRGCVSRARVSRMERGLHGHGPIDEAARILDALSVRAEVVIRPPMLANAPTQRDEAHARVVAYSARNLGRTGFALAREVPVGADRVRGWIDILGMNTALHTLVVVEGKADLFDVGALERQVAWYEREAPLAARRLGWPPQRRTLVLVTMLATLHNADVVRSNRDILGERFPLPVTGLRALLAGQAAPPGPLRTIAFVDPARRGSGWLLPTPLAAGRPVLPYEDARSFLDTTRARGDRRAGRRSGTPSARLKGADHG